MAVIPKDPLDWLTLFRQQIDEIFNYLSTLQGKDERGEHEYSPFVDIYETADRFMVEYELPGFEPEDLRVSICCNMLVVEGIKRDADRCQSGNYICLERHFGRFCRAVEIPPAVDSKSVTARYEKGVLQVSLPWLQDKGSIIRNIPIAQGDSDGKQT